jgi:hypothetical protein
MQNTDAGNHLDTLPKLLFENNRKHPSRVAMRKKDFGIWNPYTWEDCYINVKYFALGLKEMGFQPGDIYSEQLFQSIDDRITALPFVSITDPSDIGFYANKAVINMNAKYNRAGKFDAMLGVIPTGAANASNRLNGYIDMHLPNLFQSAIQLDLQWRAFGQQAQSIQAKTAIPVIGKTSIGLSFGGDILRQDSSFVNSQAGFRLWSGLTPRTRLSVGYDRAYSNRLSTDLDVYNSFGYDWYAIGLCRNCECLVN